MNTNRIFRRLVVSAAIMTMSLAVPAYAQHHGTPHGRPGPGYHDGGYRGRGGGAIWWGLGLGLGLGWSAGYYGYPYPTYYYPPDYYPPYYYYPGPATVVVPPSPPAQTNWYYCDSLKNYYPTVDHCPEQWRIVPATPPVQQTQPAQPAH